ncbi:hypothetical protein [Gimesia alba]|uniref:hypothetical protein n=1 Tax=Gimesia alba TaxID=2527973 RepID=UPI00119E55A1|nr:hypothetical protein [Gimesia alba]
MIKRGGIYFRVVECCVASVSECPDGDHPVIQLRVIEDNDCPYLHMQAIGVLYVSRVCGRDGDQ